MQNHLIIVFQIFLFSVFFEFGSGGVGHNLKGSQVDRDKNQREESRDPPDSSEESIIN